MREKLNRAQQKTGTHYTPPRFYGGAAGFWEYEGREAILHGPYETGKTYVALHKLHSNLLRFPHSRALMVRETYKSLVGSAVVTYEHKVLDVPPGLPGAIVQKYGGEKPEFYTYPNGSRLTCGGLDTPDKFLSAEFDFIYINQAEEIRLNDYELLLGRATGRAGNAPFTQVTADCNPGPPDHWILEREDIKLFQQMHEHNPRLFNQETGEITEHGKVTINVLDSLTGIRYQRGRLGKWVAAEGVVYDNFSLSDNVTEEAEYNPALDVYWGVDDGYAHGEGPGSAGYHPRVFILGQQQHDGSFHIFDEYARTLELPEASINNVLALPYSPPTLAMVDSSAAELRRRLSDTSIMNAGATHQIVDGIKVVRRYICDGHNVINLKVHPRCKKLIRSLQSYRYDDKSSVVNAGEPKPLKVDDHEVDALRYLLWNFR